MGTTVIDSNSNVSSFLSDSCIVSFFQALDLCWPSWLCCYTGTGTMIIDSNFNVCRCLSISSVSATCGAAFISFWSVRHRGARHNRLRQVFRQAQRSVLVSCLVLWMYSLQLSSIWVLISFGSLNSVGFAYLEFSVSQNEASYSWARIWSILIRWLATMNYVQYRPQLRRVFLV